MSTATTTSAITERGNGRATTARCLLLLPLLALLGLVAVEDALAQASGPSEETAVSGARAAAPEGAALFAANCSVCHGATGLGLAEAKQAFPSDHRNCTHCHKRGNPPTMTLLEIEARQHDLFDIGEPPPLRGEDAMAAHAGREALRAYITATMPRYRPGALSEAEYGAITEFLLALNGR